MGLLWANLLSLGVQAAMFSPEIAKKSFYLASNSLELPHNIRNWTGNQRMDYLKEVRQTRVFWSQEIKEPANWLLAAFEPPPIFGYVARLAGSQEEPNCAVVFRGSEGPKDVFVDANFLRMPLAPDLQTICQPGHCQVHRGFHYGYLTIHQQLMEALEDFGCSRLWVVGHSLGGALATLFLGVLPPTYKVSYFYSFGSPRVGNFEFRQAIEKAYPQAVFRITHYRDPVSHVPPAFLAYYHVGTEYYYSLAATRADQFYRCTPQTDGSDDPECSAKATLWESLFRSFGAHVTFCRAFIGDVWDDVDAGDSDFQTLETDH